MKESNSKNNESISHENEVNKLTSQELVNQLELITKKFNKNSMNIQNKDDDNNQTVQNKILSNEQKNGFFINNPQKLITPTIIMNQKLNEQLNSIKHKEDSFNDILLKKNIKNESENKNYNYKAEMINILIKEKSNNFENEQKKVLNSYSSFFSEFNDECNYLWEIGSNCKFPEKIIKNFLGKKTKEKDINLSFGDNPLEYLKDIQNNMTDPPPAKNKSFSKNGKFNQKQNKDQNFMLQKCIKNLPVFYPPDDTIFQKDNYFIFNRIYNDSYINNNSIDINEDKKLFTIKDECDEETCNDKKINNKKKLIKFIPQKKINSAIILNDIPNVIEINKKVLGNIYVCNNCEKNFWTKQELIKHVNDFHGKKKKKDKKKKSKNNDKNTIVYIFNEAKKMLFVKYIQNNQKNKGKSFEEYFSTEEGKNEVNNLTGKYSDEFQELMAELEIKFKNKKT